MQIQSGCLQAKSGVRLNVFIHCFQIWGCWASWSDPSIYIQCCPAEPRLVLRGECRSPHTICCHHFHPLSIIQDILRTTLEQCLHLGLKSAVWTQKSHHSRHSWKWNRGKFSSFPSKVVFWHHFISLMVCGGHDLEMAPPEYYFCALWCYLSRLHREKRRW